MKDILEVEQSFCEFCEGCKHLMPEIIEIKQACISKSKPKILITCENICKCDHLKKWIEEKQK